ncbi:capsular polysaccharide synthesis protein [Dysgonomonas mossii]|uniref:Capsular biosynthesis protein n=1 Tax=Dysgonomonas mossii TaxID=163665 RepID=A0A4Y9IQ35_9BACT|nr:capsular polysaccharide synthesis protein [Dysgonomonas mossii]MBF0760833.1 capsular polysaccharide synthesis protein [Dysgonomonas mossii]TFU89795.1 capsular biosynthesis protein [Dysgonomonas mossii]
MEKLSKIFKKAGGKSLIKQYWKTGVLGFAIIEALLLGFSKKGLEILRLSVQYKTQAKLKKKYQYVLDRCDKIDYDSLPKEQSNKVWVCWLQGMENAPLVVQKCHASLHKYLKDKEIILLTSNNIQEYITLPLFIMDKWEKGIISNAHFSDLIRVELLIRYGGTWIDSTVLCTGSNIPNYILNSNLFFYQLLKPGRDGHCLNISNWFISSSTNNKIILILKELLHEYWIKNNSVSDYYIFHMFVGIICEKYPEEEQKITKFCNSIPHILQLDLFEPFDEDKFEAIKHMTCFHKLSYKFEEELLKKKGTFYDIIINKKQV